MKKSNIETAVELYNDLALFSRAIFPHKLRQEPSPVHLDMYDALQNYNRFLALIIPRGFAKSTITSIIYPIYRIVNKEFMFGSEPDFIAIVSESQKQSINFLSAIKFELEYNQKILSIYGRLKGDTWSKTEIVTKNNVKVVALGTGQKIRGLVHNDVRPRCIILDDFESETNSMTEVSRRANKDWITGAVIPSLAPKEEQGRLIAVGTIIHEDSFLYERLDDPSWKTIYAQAILPGNKSLWEARFPIEELLRIKDMYARQGRLYVFYREYMNIPIDVEKRPFEIEKIKYYSHYDWDEYNQTYYVVVDGEKIPVSVYAGVDPAISISTKADYTVILFLGIDHNGNRYVLDYVRARMLPDQIIDTTIELVKKFKPVKITFEGVAFQEMLHQSFRTKMYQANVFTRTDSVKPSQKKEVRLLSLQPIVSSGRLYIRENMTHLVEEMQVFPAGKHDDVLDALYFANLDARPTHLKTLAKEINKTPIEEFLDELKGEKEYDWRLL